MADNNYMLRTGLEDAGYSDIKYDEGSKNLTAVKNGQTYGFNTSGLSNVDGHLVGSQDQVQSIINNPLQGARDYGIKKGLNVGVDAYNNPTYNGQSLDTAGMTLINGRWYGRGSDLNKTASSILPQEFQSNYSKLQKNILNDLLNYKEFSYNPESDADLQNAMELARRQAQRNAVDRGQGNSFGMEYASSAAANSLIPQYRQQARQEYDADRNYLAALYGLANQGYQTDLDTYNTMRNFSNQDREHSAQENYRGQTLAQDESQFRRTNDLNWAKVDQANNQWYADFVREGEQWDKNFALALQEFEFKRTQTMNEIEKQNFQEGLQVAAMLGYVPSVYADILKLPAGAKTLQAISAHI